MPAAATVSWQRCSRHRPSPRPCTGSGYASRKLPRLPPSIRRATEDRTPMGEPPGTAEQLTGDWPFRASYQLAGAVASGEISATQLLDAQLARVRRYNPALNAIVALDEQRALERARDA